MHRWWPYNRLYEVCKELVELPGKVGNVAASDGIQFSSALLMADLLNIDDIKKRHLVVRKKYCTSLQDKKTS